MIELIEWIVTFFLLVCVAGLIPAMGLALWSDLNGRSKTTDR